SPTLSFLAAHTRPLLAMSRTRMSRHPSTARVAGHDAFLSVGGAHDKDGDWAVVGNLHGDASQRQQAQPTVASRREGHDRPGQRAGDLADGVRRVVALDDLPGGTHAAE